MSNSFRQYRNSKPFASDSESEGDDSTENSVHKNTPINTFVAYKMSLETEQIKVLIRALQEQALEGQRREADLRNTVQELAGQLADMQVAPVRAETGFSQCALYRRCGKCVNGAMDRSVIWGLYLF